MGEINKMESAILMGKAELYKKAIEIVETLSKLDMDGMDIAEPDYDDKEIEIAKEMITKSRELTKDRLWIRL